MASRPYDRLYRHECGEFDIDFIRLCISNFSTDSNGAEKHYEMLVNHVPSGWTYHGKVSRAYAHQAYSDTSKFQIIDGITLYDRYGDPLPSDQVLLVMKEK